MNKMNKKGFTRIEMLVVIAIIAVLVSIIIPTVSSATTKAAAATNAANLRSFQAELTTASLAGAVPTENATTHEWTNGVDTFKAPEFKQMKWTAGSDTVDGSTTEVYAKATRDTTTGEWTVAFTVASKDYTIADFAEIAEDGKMATAKQ